MTRERLEQTNAGGLNGVGEVKGMKRGSLLP